MTQSIYCPMIHGGLHLVAHNNNVYFRHCCLSSCDTAIFSESTWQSLQLNSLREQNNANNWDSGCNQCKNIELTNQHSMRTGMLDNFGVKQNLSGPQRIDLMFDKSCNLACRICGPDSSTLWQKHLTQNNIKSYKIENYNSSAEQIILALSKLDLSNLKMVVMCGGETLMGANYWKVAEYIATTGIPQQITLSFQTNGTQTINEKYYDLINRFHLVKLNISLDGVKEKFNYQRWPADWQQVVSNIFALRESLPTNVMFLIEETISIFNLYYQEELSMWVEKNFSTNRLGDMVNHTRHFAQGSYGLHNLTYEYIDALQKKNLLNYVNDDFVENPIEIKSMISTIKQFDLIRNEDFSKIFPEVAEFYSRYI